MDALVAAFVAALLLGIGDRTAWLAATLSSRFERQGAPTTFMDALANMSGFMRFMARVAGRSPSYTRWRSKVVIDVDGATEEGTGTIEFMDFE